MILFALTRKATDKAIERLTSAVREAMTTRAEPHRSGHYELIKLESAAMRVAEGESVEEVARSLSLKPEVLRRWLRRR